MMVLKQGESRGESRRISTMIKKTLVVLGGVLLSTVLLVVGAWMMLRLTPIGSVVSGNAVATVDNQDPFEAMSQFIWISNSLLFPAIAVGVGDFVGLLAENRTLPLAVGGMLPAVIFFLAGHSWAAEALVYGLGYFALSAIVASLVGKVRLRRGSGEQFLDSVPPPF
jgi:hypothetical protein